MRFITTETNVLDRTGWPYGPWDRELDAASWEVNGVNCYIQRNHHGAWCGYIAVPLGHPVHESPYNRIMHSCPIHGGFTHGGPSAEDDSYLLGFDCSHSGDFAPGHFSVRDRTYATDSMIGDYVTQAQVINMLNGMANDMPNWYEREPYSWEEDSEEDSEDTA